MFVRKYQVDYLWEETDRLWDAVSELSALIEFLVEKQEKAQRVAKATAKVASTVRTKKA